VLVALDGTGNDKDRDTWERPKGNVPSNVAIMYELYRGKAIYRWGVGTRTDILFGNLSGLGADDRMGGAMNELKAYLKQNPEEYEKVDIIGFSRGAAMSRIFANMLKTEIPCARVRFLGLFDTVAQFGVPNLLNYQFGYDLSLDLSSIGYTAHAVAADEHRKLFPLTSITSVYAPEWGFRVKLLPEEFVDIVGLNYEEKPFRGVHSEIGGGGYRDSRNMEALRWMIAKGQAAGAPFWDLNEANYPEIGNLHDLKNKPGDHDSRYWFMDRIPFTHIGRYKPDRV
jgi:hypothetical protein